MAAEPAGNSLDSNSGGGGHGSRTNHRNARPGAVYGWVAGYRPGYRGNGLLGTPTHRESRPGDCSRFRCVAARLLDDLSRGRSIGISPHRGRDDYGAMPGAACDLRRKHWPAELGAALSADDL